MRLSVLTRVQGEIPPSPAKPSPPTAEPRSPLEEGEIRDDPEDEARRREEALKRLGTAPPFPWPPSLTLLAAAEAKGVRARGQKAMAKPKPKAAAAPKECAARCFVFSFRFAD